MIRVSVIIPTYRAAKLLPALLSGLERQTLPPDEVVVIDSSSGDGTDSIARERRCTVTVIPKRSFSHGGTRNLGASLAHGDILIFMTQDAIPADDHFVEELTRPVREGSAVASYGRQLPRKEAAPPEAFAREFNYPQTSHLRNDLDVSRMGSKAYFFSDVASCVLTVAFKAVGGFSETVILSEDTVLCAQLMKAGNSIAYVAEARVLHSHNYRLLQQFKRYFDIGAAYQQAGALLGGSKIGGDGARFAIQQLAYLIGRGHWPWVPRTTLEIALKYLGYQLGRHERLLPRRLKRSISMHPLYWDH